MRTRTSPRPGGGAWRSRSSSTSGPPNRLMTIAFTGPVLELLQRAVHELDAAGAGVAHAEHAGDAGLHQIGPPAQRPLRGEQIFGRQIGAGLHELLFVVQQAPREPSG